MTGGGRLRRLLSLGALLGLVLAGCGVSRPVGSARKSDVRTAAGVTPLRVGSLIGWGTTYSLNALSSGFLPELNGFSLLPLAMDLPPTFGRYLPELASSWATTSSTVTVHLRAGARWQDGRPVTARDVVTTLELQGVETGKNDADGIWPVVSGVNAPNPDTVVVNVRGGQSTALVLDKLLAIEPVPASEYGQFLTPGLAQQLEAYWSRPQSKQGEAAAASIAAVRQRLDDYNPRTFVGDGPYRFVKITIEAILLTKWSGFWNAPAIHVPALSFVAPAGLAGLGVTPPTPSWADLVPTGMTYLEVERWLKAAHTYATGADTFDLSVLAFDEHRYPVNLLPVRQAVADVINRHTIMALANGGGSPDRAVAYPTGLPPAVQTHWLAPSRLRAYAHDLGAAAKVLRAAGFRQRGGKWYGPNGKRLTLTIDGSTLGAISTNNTVSRAVAGMLEAFGIRVREVNVIGDLDWGMSGEDGLDPLVAFDNLLGPEPLFTTSYRSLPANSRPATAEIPGLGTVNVAQTLRAEVASVSAGPTMRRLVGDWASYVNRQLPYLPLAEIYQQIVYSSARYTDWPAASSPLWELVGLSGNDGIVNILERGYIRPVARGG